MVWFKVDDTFHSSRKVKAIPRAQRLAAIGLWTLAGTWSAQEETDGSIPAYIVEDLGGEKSAEWLVKVGLWDEADDGYLFHDWTDYQPTRAQLDERREKERQRIANKRATRKVVASNTEPTPPQVDPVLNYPVPSRPVPLTDRTTNTSSPTEVDARDEQDDDPVASQAELYGIRDLGRLRKAIGRHLGILDLPSEAELVDMVAYLDSLTTSHVRSWCAYIEKSASSQGIRDAWSYVQSRRLDGAA